MSGYETPWNDDVIRSSPGMTYARARLWLGITGVGMQVVLAAAVLIRGLPGWVAGSETTYGLEQVAQIALLLAMYAALMLPLDWLGGFVLPRNYGRSEQRAGSYFIRWGRGIAVQFLLLFVVANSLLAIGSRFGNVAVVLGVVLFGLLGIAFQASFARLFGAFTSVAIADLPDTTRCVIETASEKPSRIQVWDSADRGFTGGITGWKPRVILPLHWVRTLPPEQLKLVLARRAEIIHGGWRLVGLSVAFLWVLAGSVGSLLLLNGRLDTVAELARFVCWNNLWIFLGLLLLPTASRRATLAIDREMYASRSDSDMQQQHVFQDRLQDDEPERPSLIETIFHPIPSVASRSAPQAKVRFSAWHSARTMLFLSYACGGLLARSVHCNLGRPDLWVLFPTD
ncbi:MAG: hypothetical protein ACE37I_10955 [Rubinisphaera brasiliensis]|uniref:hypothetical protein n=1 Tax=Rubinisphaera brasiliensis TaxID=119 RepID=UPI003919DF4A